MSLFNFEHSSSAGHSSLAGTVFSSVDGLRTRAVASWRRHRAERALESLSYDTLKDIGFPSAEMLDEDNSTR